MWNQLLTEINPKNNESVHYLVLDTEGICSVEESSNHDVKIFLLAMLLSSFFVYNSIGTIDENAIQNLSLIVNLSKMLQNVKEDQ